MKKREFPSASEVEKHLKQNALIAHGGAKYFPPMKFHFYQYQADVADDGSFTLPFSLAYAAWGWIASGTATSIGQYATFMVDGSGDVTLIDNTSGVVANADTDGKLCLGTAASQEPLVIKNRLGVSKHITLFMVCN